MRQFALLVVLVTAMAMLHAQEPPATPPAAADYQFEVASVKQNKSGERNSGIRREPGGRVTVTNVPLRLLITFAYQLGQYQLAGGPSWVGDDRLDITAKMEGNPDWGGPGTGRPDPIMVAMRHLLADRFKLKFHIEQRDLDAYALVLAKAGVTGPQLKPSTTDCAALMKEAQAGKLPPPPPGPPSFDKPIPCSIMGRIGAIAFDGFPMTQAATMLVGQAGRPVVDRTGLTGNWQFVLTFAQERPLGAPAAENVPAPDPNAPSFFTALEEQLGLKLEATKAPFAVTVIDSAEHPTDD